MRALLDINVLIALFDTIHQHHELAKDWFCKNIRRGWASTPITQNGFLRIVTQPKYPRPISFQEAVELLFGAARTAHHEFWPDAISVLDAKCFNHEQVHGPRQLTDIYLLALAVDRGARFVTFDQSISLRMVIGAERKHLVVL